MPVEPPATPWMFPPVTQADDHDLVAVGADLEPGTVLAAYRAGLFPMPIRRRGPIGWWSPEPRGILDLADLRVPRSLRQSVKRFEIRVDTAFDVVLDACADPKRPHGWIDKRVTHAYRRLHALGWAHSVEAWDRETGDLAGGLYGVAIGALFAGESMFHRVRDASKVALVGLVEILAAGPGADAALLDVQWQTPHLASLGVHEVSRAAYVARLQRALDAPGPWSVTDVRGGAGDRRGLRGTMLPARPARRGRRGPLGPVQRAERPLHFAGRRADGVTMNDKRTILPLALGAAAAVLGVLALVLDLAVLGLAAGLLAVGIAVLARRTPAAPTTSPAADSQVSELESALAAQVQARIAAEDAVRSLGQQLASAERDVANRAPIVVPAKRNDSLTDEATGLFSEDYFRVAVDARIAAARRHLRPVAVVLLEVIEGLRSGAPTSAQPMLVAEMINATLREADTACRLIDGRFGLVLEDTSENGAIWTVERIRRSIADTQQGLTLRAGIACYPAHAFGSSELLQRADDALVSARDWNQDRIEVANVE